VVALAWFQLAVFNPLGAEAGATPAPDPALLAWQIHLARLLEMAGLVGIALLGFATRSLAVSVAYIVAGAYFAFRWPIWISFRRTGDWEAFTWWSDANLFLDDAGRALMVSGLVILSLVWRDRLARQATPTS
jgi:hypothetical protein